MNTPLARRQLTWLLAVGMIGLVAAETSSCDRTPKVQADQKSQAELPTVAVAKVSTGDLSHVLVLTAEFYRLLFRRLTSWPRFPDT